MTLFDVLAVAEATKIKERVKRVNQPEYSDFLENNVFLHDLVYKTIYHANMANTPYLYVVTGDCGIIELATYSYEDAIRYALNEFIKQIDFTVK